MRTEVDLTKLTPRQREVLTGHCHVIGLVGGDLRP